MSIAHWLEYKIDTDPKKPGRQQEVFDLKVIEAALDAPITYVYSNHIQPGATAGRHYHKQHQVAVWMREGELEMTLEDINSHQREVINLKPGNRLLLIPRLTYHAAVNKTEKPALAIMFATTMPRDPNDEWH
jgi:oxalate decarboxylase/phosphoglucose isomerase-like protein (cupin superfamily)